jgi:hypothetical protein
VTVTDQRMSLESKASAWGALRDRSRSLAHWTDRAVQLANEAASEPPKPSTPAGGRLRYIPPVAALGVAAVLQVVAMTDLAGGPVAQALAASPQTAPYAWAGYLAGFLLGVAVASCVEGGAAYLMDLYDKHLMARDSTWLLRLGMVVYVGASTGLLHWYLDYRHMPTLVSWVLAGMSGLSLFLWSRGSRWANRVQMRDAGQLDPALPKLPMTAKVLHPWRWLVTLYLTSWEPVATTDEARQRYAEWRTERRTRTVKAVEAPAPVAALPVEPQSAPDTALDNAESSAPGDDETAAQRVRADKRTSQQIADAVRFIAAAQPDLSRNQIALIANCSATKVRTVLGPAIAADGAQPDGADS